MENAQMLKMFGDLLSSGSMEKISAAAGTDKKVTSNIVSQALPELLKGLGQQTSTSEGLSGLMGALDSKHTGDIFSSDSGIDMDDGNKILGHILGGQKENIIGNIASSIGASGSETGGVLSSMAPLLLGSLGKAKKQGSMDISDLSSMLSGGGGMSSKLITSFLDKDGDGDIKDDLLNMGMNYIKKSFLKK